MSVSSLIPRDWDGNADIPAFLDVSADSFNWNTSQETHDILELWDIVNDHIKASETLLQEIYQFWTQNRDRKFSIEDKDALAICLKIEEQKHEIDLTCNAVNDVDVKITLLQLKHEFTALGTIWNLYMQYIECENEQLISIFEPQLKERLEAIWEELEKFLIALPESQWLLRKYMSWKTLVNETEFRNIVEETMYSWDIQKWDKNFSIIIEWEQKWLVNEIFLQVILKNLRSNFERYGENGTLKVLFDDNWYSINLENKLLDKPDHRFSSWQGSNIIDEIMKTFWEVSQVIQPQDSEDWKTYSFLVENIPYAS